MIEGCDYAGRRLFIGGQFYPAISGQFCAAIDTGGEFDAETTNNALQLLKEAMGRFGWLTSIREVLTDRGT